jgi:hypothetical protein
MDEKLRLEYVSLSKVILWENNLKLHDIGGVINSIKQHGFKDPPKYEPYLNNGSGGIVEGNGRSVALDNMRKNGENPPRGVLVTEDGDWLIPILFGVDADSEAAAEAYGIDHNVTTILGGDFDITDHMRMWEHGFVDQLIDLREQSAGVTSFSGDDIDLLRAAAGFLGDASDFKFNDADIVEDPADRVTIRVNVPHEYVKPTLSTLKEILGGLGISEMCNVEVA